MKVTRNELRLGNLLDFEGETCIVREIDSSGAVVLFNNNEEYWIDLFQFNGIPLTEEWFLKFGFENNNGFWSLKNIDILDFKLNKDYIIIFNENPANSGISGRKLIKYVHQLQNLYFALTGEELTLSNANESL